MKLKLFVVILLLIMILAGAQAAAVLYFNPILKQDFTDFPVWYPNGTTIGATTIVTGRWR